MRKNKLKLICTLVVFFSLTYASTYVFAQEQKWPGVDKTVIEKIAQEHGRPAKNPVINTDQGDMLLFVFLLAGSIGGFLIGFYWRKLFVKKNA